MPVAAYASTIGYRITYALRDAELTITRGPAGPGLSTVFCAEGDWRRAEAEVTRAGDTVHMVLAGDGDLDAAAVQACRFLALDVDGRGWPEAGRRDPVTAGAQARLPGLRRCGFHSPYQAAAWSVLATVTETR